MGRRLPLIAAALMLALLAATTHFARAHTITPNGSSAEWLARAPVDADTGIVARNALAAGEYIWKDKSLDERTELNGGSADPRVDLREVRYTGDASNLYVLVKVASLPTTSGVDTTQIQLAIDKDRVPGSGDADFVQGAETQASGDAEWEYLVQTRFGSGNANVAVWPAGGGAPVNTGSEANNPDGTIELAVPWSALGFAGPPSTPLRFTVAAFRSTASDGTQEAVGSDALDVVTDYGDPGSPLVTTGELGDSTVNYYADVWFTDVGEVRAPIVISRIATVFASPNEGAEFIEIANTTTSAINLTPYKVGDESSTSAADEGMHSFPLSTMLPGGERRIIARDGAAYQAVNGQLPNFELIDTSAAPNMLSFDLWSGGGDPNFSDTGDELLALDASNTIIDVVPYGGGVFDGIPALAVLATGEIQKRMPSLRDTDNELTPDFTAATCAGKVWDGGAGTNNWFAAANWSGDALPAAGDNVCIPSTAHAAIAFNGAQTVQSVTSDEPLQVTGGTLTLASSSQESTFAGLTLNGSATITGPADITIPSGAVFDWNGTGHLSSNPSDPGKLTISPGAQLLLRGGSADHRIQGGRVLENYGVVDYSQGYVGLYRTSTANRTTFRNFTTIDISHTAADTGFYFWDGDSHLATPARLENMPGATISKTGNAATHRIDVVFDNDGTLNVDQGTEELDGSGIGAGDAGALNVAAGARVEVTGGRVFDGPVDVDGQIVLNGGTAVGFNNDATSLADLVVTSSSHAVLNMGAITLPQTTLNSSAVITGSADITVPSGGLFDWNGTAHLRSDPADPSTLTIAAGGELLLRGGSADHRIQGGRIVENFGTVDHSQGYVGLYRTSTANRSTLRNFGSYLITHTAADDAFYFWDGDSHLATPGLLENGPGGQITKSGNAPNFRIDVVFDNDGAVAVNQGTLQLDGPGTASGDSGTYVVLASGRLESTNNRTFNGVMDAFGQLQVNGGTATFTNAGANIQDFLISDAAVAAFDMPAVTLPKVTQTNGGWLTGTADILIPPGGLYDWNGSGTLSGDPSDPATLTISDGAELRLSGASVDHRVRGGRVIENFGTTDHSGGYLSLYRTSTANRTTFRNHNTYLISHSAAQDGFYFNDADTHLPMLGLFENVAGATLTKTGNAPTFRTDVVFDNDGVVNVNDGRFYIAAPGNNVDLGSYNVVAGKTLEFNGSRTVDGPINGAGADITFTGGNIVLNGVYTNTNAPTTRLNGGSVTFAAQATIGSLLVAGGNGTFAADTSIDTATMSSGSVTANGPTTLGTLTQSGGTAVLNTPTSPTAVTLSGGTLRGSGDLNATNFTWTGGRHEAPVNTVSTTVTGTLALGGTTKNFNTRTLNINTPLGTPVVWSGGDVALEGSAIVNNRGRVELAADADITGTTAQTWHNLAGSELVKTAGAVSGEDSYVQVGFNNQGLVAVNFGLFRLLASGAHLGPFTVGTSGQLRWESGTHTMGGSVTGTGSLATPGAPTTTAFSTLGSLATGTYLYRVTALNVNGETLASSETAVDVTGPAGRVEVSWPAVPQAASYRVYRRTAGGPSVFHTVGGTFLNDTGGGTAGSPPAANTSAAKATFSGGTTTFNAGYDVPQTVVTGGTHTFAAATTLGTVSQSAGTTIFNTPTFPDRINFSGGTMAGSADMTVSHLNWTGGRLQASSNSVETNVTTVLQLAGTTKPLDTRTLNNATPLATPTVWASGDIGLEGSAIFNHEGRLEIAGDVDVTGSSSQTFNNLPGAEIVKTAGASSGEDTYFQTTFRNDGTVAVNVGLLRLLTNGTHSGPYNIGSSGQLRSEGGTQTFGGPVTGAAPLATPTGVTATPFTTGGALPAATHLYRVTAVNINGESLPSVETPAVVVTAAGRVELNWTAVPNAVTYRVYRRIGTGPSVFYTVAGTSFVDTGAAATAGSPTTVNTSGAKMVFQGGTIGVNAVYDVPTTNITGGSPTFNGVPTLGTLNASSGTGTFNAASTIQSMSISSGTVNFNAPASVETMTMSAGNLGGSGVLTLTGPVDSTWSGGSMNEPGTTRVGPAATLNVTTATAKTLRRAFDNQGTTRWEGGLIQAGAGSVFANSGLLLATSNDIYQHNQGGSSTFNNTGVVRKTGSDGTTLINGTINNTGGTFDVRLGGTLQLGGTFTNFSGTTLSGGTYLVEGTLRFVNANIVTNEAAIVLKGSDSIIRDNTAGVVNALRNLARIGPNGSLKLDDQDLHSTGTRGPQLEVDGVLGGTSGTVFANVVNDTGTVAPGLSAGTLTIDGTYTQNAGGTLETEIESLASHDLLTVTGAASLNGTVTAKLVDPFQLPVAAAVLALSAGSRSGTFDFVTSSPSPLPGNLRPEARYDATTATLFAVPGGGAVDDSVDEGAGTKTITVTLSAAPGATASVHYETADGTATAGEDYTARTGDLSFGAGDTSASFDVPILQDQLDEVDESFLVNLTAGDGVELTDTQATLTILDDDDEPTVSIGDVIANEGTGSGSTGFILPVSLSASSGKEVTVDFATVEDLATEIADFTATSGTLTFAPGETAKTVIVQVMGDSNIEFDERLFVNLSNPVNAVIGDGQGTVTIVDDDQGITSELSIDDVQVSEGDAGTVNATFTVSLTGTPSTPVSVNYSTLDVTAEAGEDYGPEIDTLVFGTDTSKTITVQVIGDKAAESAETFLVQLSNPVGASLADANGTGLISDDDVAPVVEDQFDLELDEDDSLPITLGPTTDEEGDNVTYELVSSPVHGSISGLPGNELEYTPDPDYTGGDSFSVRSFDGENYSNVATIELFVNPVNDAPRVVDDTASISEDGVLELPALANDVDVDSDYTIVSVESPTPFGGTAEVIDEGTAIRYQPRQDYNGFETFEYTVEDIEGLQATGEITVFVSPVNDAPVAVNDLAVAAEDDPFTVVGVLGNDSDADEGDNLLIWNVNDPPNGEVELVGNTVRYRPNPNYNGPDNFTYTIIDGHGGEDTAEVAVTVTPVNDAPVAANVTATFAEDTSETITLPATDVDGNPLAYSASSAVNGSVVVNGNQATFTPTGNYHGPASFTFKANDGTVDSNVGTASLTITPVNDRPVADDAEVSALEDGTVTIVLSSSDVEGSPRTYEIWDEPSHGELEGSGDEWTYTPDFNYNGGDSFRFRVNDGELDSAIATVLINVVPVNDDPVAEDQSITTVQGQPPVTFTLHASDVDGDELDFSVPTQPDSGTVTIDGNAATYTPNGNFTGTDSFTFRVDDGDEGTDFGTVNVTVLPPGGGGDAVLASIADVTVDEGNDEAVFTLNLSGQADGTRIHVQSADGTAKASSDYTSYDATFTFTGGSTSELVRVKLKEDALDEDTERFVLNFEVEAAPPGGVVALGPADGFIVDNDPTPSLSITNATLTEGNAGTQTAELTVSLSAPSGRVVSVDYATQDGTATAADGDYTPRSGTLTFVAGETAKIVGIPIHGDATVELNEALSVVLSEAVNAGVAVSSGAISITNDDSLVPLPPPPPPPPPPAPLPPTADLGITMGAPPTSAVDQAVTYSITVRNAGPDTATGVTVTDALPGGLQLVSASVGQVACGAPGGVVSCAVGTLASGASAAVTIVATTTEPGVHTNTASVAGNQADPAAANNSVSATTRVPVPVVREPQQRTSRCTLVGTPGDDVLRGGPGRDVICGFGGDDVLIGFGGNDKLLGGLGNDKLYGGNGSDVIKGGNGSDLLQGGKGNDKLDGGRGRDSLLGGPGADHLNGGYGNDYVSGGRDKDRVLGGPGKDRLRRDRQDVALGGPGGDTCIVRGAIIVCA